ncbi:uncharacterized protein [Henckelia pumila]|uniref:uncharacterized protein n=1 Tax=Henckelia pumila TaxID=405737 RepID=UPI003C6E6267
MVNSGNLNFNDPLFIHPSDTPGMNLITDRLTGVENYGIWSRAMLIALRAKKKISLIDGTNKRPHAGAGTVSQWERVNALVLSWIMNSVSKEIFGGIVYATEAHVVGLKQLWDEYASLVTLPSCECDTARKYIEHDQRHRLLQFLLGLNESYIHI